jgi:hypothetical protein
MTENYTQLSVIDKHTFSKSAGFIERLAAKAAAIASSCSIVGGVDEIELLGCRLNEVGGMVIQIVNEES